MKFFIKLGMKTDYPNLSIKDIKSINVWRFIQKLEHFPKADSLRSYLNISDTCLHLF